MCGLVGMIARNPRGFFYKDIDIFDELLYVDALRGMDSTGIVTVENTGDFHIDKEATEAAMFAFSYNDLESRKRVVAHGSAMLGHNRKSTVGKTTDHTAHPFVIKDRFAFMHNGTLFDHKKIANTEVDSEALGILMERTINDPDYSLDLLATALEDVSGAYACVWYNQLRNEVQLIRNSQRPLFLVEGKEAWYYASEPGMLQWILGRNDIVNTTMTKVEEDTLYTFCPGGELAYKKESVPVKKYSTTHMAVSTTALVGVLGNKPVNNEEENIVSKGQYKKMRGTWVGKSLAFSVYDYVEAYVHGKGDDYYIMGFTPELEGIKHMVRGKINLTEQQVYAIDYIDHYDFEGEVQSVSYNKQHKQIEFELVDIKQVSFTKVNNETSIAVH